MNLPRTFRPKHYLVTAVEYDGTVESAIACRLQGHPTAHRPYIDTAAGSRCFVNPGDWVVADGSGFRTTYTPTAFWAQFEEVEP